MPVTQSPANTRRLSRDDFLARALEVLAREGASELRIDRLVAAIGVTKGSFYWHFENRADFVRSLAEYWKEWSTDAVIEEIGDLGLEPRHLLFRIHEIVTRDDLARYDLVMRSWSAHEPEVAKIVRSVDTDRYRFVRGLFAQLGYEGEDLEVRASAYIVSSTFWTVINRRESRKQRLKRLAAVLELLTAP